MKIEIRECREADIPRLQIIREAAFAPVFESFRNIVGTAIAKSAFGQAEVEQAKHLEEICGRESGVYVVAICGEEIVGFCGVNLNAEQKVGEIGLNAVHPDHAGQGIGTEMYRFALEYMRKAGMTTATVGTGGDTSHQPARRAYEKVGFEISIPSVWLYQEL